MAEKTTDLNPTMMPPTQSNQNVSPTSVITQDSLLPGIIKQRHLVSSPTQKGDLYYGLDGNSFANLPITDVGKVLTVQGNLVPGWSSIPAPVSINDIYFQNNSMGALNLSMYSSIQLDGNNHILTLDSNIELDGNGSVLTLDSNIEIDGGGNILTLVNDNIELEGNGHRLTLESDAVLNGYTQATDGAIINFDFTNTNWSYVVLGGANRNLRVNTIVPYQEFTIGLKQDSTGGRTVVWFGGIQWPGGGVAPTLTASPDGLDVFEFKCFDTNNFFGFIKGQNIR